jgi:Tfp pilus assembly PilM family ATPase
VQRTLPLGVDAGSVRTRVALVTVDRTGVPSLVAVATRATAGDPAAAIAAAREELRTRERRCVLALAAPDAAVRTVTFPAMSRRERLRAARFEAARFLGAEPHETAVRVVPGRGDGCIVAVARRDALEARVAAARRAGLRPVAVDDASLALLRALPGTGAVVDVGHAATILTVPGTPVPAVRVVANGSAALSDALADALAIGADAAEARKTTIGLGGAADGARDALVDALASAIVAHRASSSDVPSIVLSGNGARLAGLASALERAVAIPVSLARVAPAATAYPADVVRAASPDWCLAYGLALWELAA